ncbi:MAG: AMP-binding protein [Idiomarina sp.]|nr:AMP-binding protein [Idiomarina sp.]
MAIAARVVNFFQMHQSGIEDYLLRVHTVGAWAEIVIKSRDLGSRNIGFNSSGSTGTPKFLVHQWQTLNAEILFFKELFQQLPLPPKRVVSLVPPHHIYGFLFTVLLPEALAVPVSRGMKSYATVLNGDLQRGDLVIAFPSLVQQLAERGQEFVEGVTLVCSTGPCPPESLHSLKQLGLSTSVEVYGSSETAGVGVRMDPATPYLLLPRWKKQSESVVLDSLQNLAFELPDQITWVDPHQFRPEGRVDNAVMVNGVNVYPAQIARKLAEHPDITDARVRLLSPQNSRGLKALLIIDKELNEPQKAALVQSVRDWAEQELSEQQFPVAYHIATQVPINAFGKEMDWSEAT